MRLRLGTMLLLVAMVATAAADVTKVVRVYRRSHLAHVVEQSPDGSRLIFWSERRFYSFGSVTTEYPTIVLSTAAWITILGVWAIRRQRAARRKL
jgi:hypothetical protein